LKAQKPAKTVSNKKAARKVLGMLNSSVHADSNCSATISITSRVSPNPTYTLLDDKLMIKLDIFAVRENLINHVNLKGNFSISLTSFLQKFFLVHFYKAFHGFGQVRFAYGGSILGSSKFTLLPQLPLKTVLDLKVVKIINLLH